MLGDALVNVVQVTRKEALVTRNEVLVTQNEVRRSVGKWYRSNSVLVRRSHMREIINQNTEYRSKFSRDYFVQELFDKILQ